MSANQWYRFLKENWPYGEWPNTISIDDWLNSENVITINGGVEDVSLRGKYDIICSYAVGEHISDASKFSDLNRELLNPDGLALHHIDFGGHRWDRYGDPFLFLKFPKFVWRLMGSARGEPNRISYNNMLREFVKSNFSISIYDKTEFVINHEDKWIQTVDIEHLQVSSATFVLRLS